MSCSVTEGYVNEGQVGSPEVGKRRAVILVGISGMITGDGNKIHNKKQ